MLDGDGRWSDLEAVGVDRAVEVEGDVAGGVGAGALRDAVDGDGGEVGFQVGMDFDGFSGGEGEEDSPGVMGDFHGWYSFVDSESRTWRDSWRHSIASGRLGDGRSSNKIASFKRCSRAIL